jgi:hypothetical protein
VTSAAFGGVLFPPSAAYRLDAMIPAHSAPVLGPAYDQAAITLRSSHLLSAAALSL